MKKLARVILGLLIVQYILGMLANLFSKIPETKSYEVFHQLGWIMLHALNGTLLLVLAIVFLVKSRGSQAMRPAIGGFVNILLAFSFGEIFVAGQNDVFSFLMSLAFLGALMSYSRIVFGGLAKK